MRARAREREGEMDSSSHIWFLNQGACDDKFLENGVDRFYLFTFLLYGQVTRASAFLFLTLEGRRNVQCN